MRIWSFIDVIPKALHFKRDAAAPTVLKEGRRWALRSRCALRWTS